MKLQVTFTIDEIIELLENKLYKGKLTAVDDFKPQYEMHDGEVEFVGYTVEVM